MVALKKNSIDETLDIVRDVEKFKTRIAELGKVQSDADASVVKAKVKNTEINKLMDARVAEANDLVTAAKIRETAHDKSIEKSVQDLHDRSGKLTKAEADLVKLQEKNALTSKKLSNGWSDLKNTKAEFENRVKIFENVMKNLCDNF